MNCTEPQRAPEPKPELCPNGMQRGAKGTTVVRFGLLSTRVLQRSQSEPPWHGWARHGMVRFASKSA